jgi:EmrB/QacA subfamily drug resistance transporter
VTDVDLAAPADSEVVADPRRWAILAVLCLSLLIVGIDGTIVNVALPSFVRELGASSSQLQWIVDAYTLVFASFLLLAGSMGDRYGRRTALTAGIVIFGAGSLASALVASPGALILTRALQGFGAAFIMPATLSILTNVFSPQERPRAIGIWAGVSGLGVAIGPITGGYLLGHFWWGSIFLVNVPVIAVALVAGVVLVPNSRDPEAPPLDYVGAALSVLMLLGLLYGIIEGPSKGWTSTPVVFAFVVGVVLLGAFIQWERSREFPLLDVTFFANPRFSAASVAVTLVFFSMFGALFFVSQYLQFVLGYDALQSGVRLLPIAFALMVGAPLSSKLVSVFGTKVVVTFGLVLVAVAMLVLSGVSVTSGYPLVGLVLIIVGVGMALAMAPATDSIMGSLPPEKAGVGSAVNDTTREVGGALGVAILGSIMSSVYRKEVTGSRVYQVARQASPQGAAAIRDSVGAAAQVAKQLPADAAKTLTAAVDQAFVHALDRTVFVGAGIALLGAIVAAVFLPANAEPATVEDQEVHGLIRQTARNLSGDSRPPRDLIGAALQSLAEAGFSSLTFHGVATRAGISTETLGRYWSSKVDLVADALRSVTLDRDLPDTGSFRGDCSIYLRETSADLTDPQLRPIIGGLIGEAAKDPDLAAALRERMLRPGQAAFEELIARADARGELREGIDHEILVDLLVGPLIYRLVVTGEPVGVLVADDVLDVVLAGSLVEDAGRPAKRPAAKRPPAKRATKR